MGVDRNAEMKVAVFFLAKFGDGGVEGARARPPVEFGRDNWREVYERFFRRFGDGRDFPTYYNSINTFRRYLRRCLAGQDILTEEHRTPLIPWMTRSRAEVWSAVRVWRETPA